MDPAPLTRDDVLTVGHMIQTNGTRIDEASATA